MEDLRNGTLAQLVQTKGKTIYATTNYNFTPCLLKTLLDISTLPNALTRPPRAAPISFGDR